MKLNLDYHKLNHTELVEICRRAGFIQAHRGIPRDDLIQLLEGGFSDDYTMHDPINEYRDAMLHMQERWPVVRSQLSTTGGCAAEHYACWVCPAARVLYCIAENCEEGLLETHGLPVPERGKKGNKRAKKGAP